MSRVSHPPRGLIDFVEDFCSQVCLRLPHKQSTEAPKAPVSAQGAWSLHCLGSLTVRKDGATSSPFSFLLLWGVTCNEDMSKQGYKIVEKCKHFLMFTFNKLTLSQKKYNRIVLVRRSLKGLFKRYVLIYGTLKAM